MVEFNVYAQQTCFGSLLKSTINLQQHVCGLILQCLVADGWAIQRATGLKKLLDSKSLVQE